MTAAEWPPEGMTFAPTSPWQNTWQCGPGTHQHTIDDLELGARVATRWASGRVACVTPLAGPDHLRRADPAPPPHYPQRPAGQVALFTLDPQEASPCA